MRILYLQTFPFWGSGSGTYARHLACEMGKFHDVAIVVPDDRKLPKVRVFPVKLPFNVAFTGHPEWPDCKLYDSISSEEIGIVYQAFLSATILAVNKFKPDIVHVHHAFPLGWVAGFIKDTYKINFVVTIHGSELPTLEKDNRYFQKTFDAMCRSRRIVPNSGWTREWFLKIFKGMFHEKTRVIPGGVDLEKFKPVNNAKSVDNVLGISAKRPLVLFAGKITKYKGVRYLVAAAKKIHGDVLILGDGPEKKMLMKRAKEMGLVNIHWIGHLGASISKLTRFYSRADVFVAPSIWDEPLGLVILEAMACKTPVVVTRKGGISLAVKDGVNGYFVRPRNSSQIVEKVNKLLDDKSLREKMGENARRIAEKKFSWEKIGHRFELVYRRFAKSRKS